jgi:hypothetical protein
VNRAEPAIDLVMAGLCSHLGVDMSASRDFIPSGRHQSARPISAILQGRLGAENDARKSSSLERFFAPADWKCPPPNSVFKEHLAIVSLAIHPPILLLVFQFIHIPARWSARPTTSGAAFTTNAPIRALELIASRSTTIRADVLTVLVPLPRRIYVVQISERVDYRSARRDVFA